MATIEPTVAIASVDSTIAPELSERLVLDNCRVIVVTDAGRLAERIRETEVDVVVIDLDLGGDDFRHVVEDLKGLDRHLGVIAVAGQCSEEDEIYLRSNGVLYLAFKPAESERLAQIVKESARKIAKKRYC